MKRLFMLVLAVLLLTASAALAGTHFKDFPSCDTTVAGLDASSDCAGAISGLGNGDVTVATQISGEAVYLCTNQGGNTALGTNKVPVDSGLVSTLFPSTEIKNGTLAFVTNPATIEAPATIDPALAGCPNDNWTASFAGVIVTRLALTGSQQVSAAGGGITPYGWTWHTAFTCTSTSTTGISGTTKFDKSSCTSF